MPIQKAYLVPGQPHILLAPGQNRGWASLEESYKAIGREIGLLDRPDALAINSADFNAMSDDEAKRKLSRIKILARARPLDKFRMVRLLQGDVGAGKTVVAFLAMLTAVECGCRRLMFS